ncbi:hypothetical protein GQX74_011423 [Glossina fuscipes]|nr:hypothetical protein GQX74_011423 [Glossina fuscipes]
MKVSRMCGCYNIQETLKYLKKILKRAKTESKLIVSAMQSWPYYSATALQTPVATHHQSQHFLNTLNQVGDYTDLKQDSNNAGIYYLFYQDINNLLTLDVPIGIWWLYNC